MKEAIKEMFNQCKVDDQCPECHSKDIEINFDGMVIVSNGRLKQLVPHHPKDINYECNDCNYEWIKT